MTADLRVDHADWLLTLDTGGASSAPAPWPSPAAPSLTLDEAAIVAAARRRAPAILARTGLAAAIAPRWPVE